MYDIETLSPVSFMWVAWHRLIFPFLHSSRARYFASSSSVLNYKTPTAKLSRVNKIFHHWKLMIHYYHWCIVITCQSLFSFSLSTQTLLAPARKSHIVRGLKIGTQNFLIVGTATSAIHIKWLALSNLTLGLHGTNLFQGLCRAVITFI